MSQEDTKYIHMVIGVYKLDYKKAGYPQLREYANKWIENPNFKSVIIRKVSITNFGIQFVYINEDVKDLDEGEAVWKEIYKDFKTTFGEVYAIDYHSIGVPKSEMNNFILKQEEIK